jgi:TRAP-type C4-dicarboxylate transport system substrate-binding protein
LQNEVLKTGRDLETWAGHRAKQLNDQAEKLWKDNGAEVIRLSAGDQAEVIRRLAPLGDEFLGSDSATKEMWELLKKTLATVPTKAPKS